MPRPLMPILALVATVIAAVPALAVTLPGPLVDDAWLAQNRNEVQLLDVGNTPKTFAAKPEFATDAAGKKKLVEPGGHIPGATLVSTREMRVDRVIDGRKVQFMIPERADFEKLARKWGVKKDVPIVIVPLGAAPSDIDDAARLYWQFKFYGEDNVAILDGGLTGWLVAGRAVESSTAATPAPGNWVATAERSALMVGSEDVAQIVAKKTPEPVQLVDARDLPLFYGLVKRGYVASAGHIPGAKVFPPELLTSQGDVARFLKPDQYRQLFRAQGIDPSKPAVTYCNSGHLASGVWFVMHEVLGNRSASLYDGSMHQWALEGRPVVISDAP